MAAQNKSTGISSGQLKKSNVPQGAHQIEVLDFTHAKWSAKKSDVSASVQLEVGVLGAKPGTSINVYIYEKNLNCPDILLTGLTLKVNGQSATTSWTYPAKRWQNKTPSAHSTNPTYYFRCSSNDFSGKVTQSPEIMFYKDITISVVDTKGRAVPKAGYIILLGTKEHLSGVTDSSGKIKLPKVPLGVHTIKFIKDPFITPKSPLKVDSPFESRKYPINCFGDNKFYKHDYVVRCGHKVSDSYRYVINPPYYEMVLDEIKTAMVPGMTPKPVSDKLYIYSPDTLSLTNTNSVKMEAVPFNGLNQHSCDAAYAGKCNVDNVFCGDFWAGLWKTTKWEVQGLPASLPIKVFTPDKYELSFSFPAPKKLSAGVKWIEDKAKPAVEKFEKFQKDTTLKQAFTYPFANPSSGKASKEQWGKNEHPLAIGSTDRPVTFKKNGKPIELSVVDAFASIKLFQDKLWGIKELIMQAIPKAGFYMDLKLKILEGKFAAKWGWKEYTDYRVFMNMAASVEMTILDVALEAGIGFSAYQVVGQIYFAIKGTVAVSVSAERTSPDNSLELSIPVAATLAGELGARVKVPLMAQFIATGTTGIELSAGQFKISTERGVIFGAGIKWTGLKGKVSVSAGPGKSGGDKRPTGEQAKAIDYSRENVWVAEKDWGKFEWPADVDAAPAEIDNKKVSDAIIRVFKANNSLVVKDANHTTLTNEKVAEQLRSQILSRKDVDKRERSIEAIAYAAKADLQKQAVWVNQSVYAISEVTFLQYCNSDSLKIILDAA